jgi:hypothetical protein
LASGTSLSQNKLKFNAEFVTSRAILQFSPVFYG